MNPFTCWVQSVFRGSYYRATENELLEDYLKAIDSLTINDGNVLERQFNKLEEIAELNLKIFEKSREIELLHKSDISKDDAIAALSDKLQNLIEEVENLKKRK